MILLIKLGGSLVAVLALAWIAKLMGLGGDVRIRDADHARALAFDALYGFAATDVVVDRAGYGALLKDAGGRHALVRKHGAHFVTRMVTPQAEGRLDQHFLTIKLAEPDFAPVTLNLGPAAQFWASGLRHLPAE
jgi:hypothetical protein